MRKINLKSALITALIFTCGASCFAADDEEMKSGEDTVVRREWTQEELVDRQNAYTDGRLETHLPVDGIVREVLAFLPNTHRVAGSLINGADLPTVVATTTGAPFTKVIDPQLGDDVWRDPNGLVWGDVIQGEDGKPEIMNQEEAFNYCLNLNIDETLKDEIRGTLENDIQPVGGYYLPTRDNFFALRTFMGGSATYGHDQQYVRQLFLENYQMAYWSSSSSIYFEHKFKLFSVANGGIYNHYVWDRHTVRCVYRANTF